MSLIRLPDLRNRDVVDALNAWGKSLEWEDRVALSRVVGRMDDRCPRLSDKDIDRIASKVVEELDFAQLSRAERDWWRAFIANTAAGVVGSAIWALLLYLVTTGHFEGATQSHRPDDRDSLVRAKLGAELSPNEREVLDRAHYRLLEGQFIDSTMFSAFSYALPEEYQRLVRWPPPKGPGRDYAAWFAIVRTMDFLLDEGAEKVLSNR